MNDRIKVLVADDEAMERKALSEILRVCLGDGVETIEAVNGRDAVEKAALERPDIVVMDLQMPVMDGLTALEAIYRVLPEVFAVILTAYDEFGYAVSALKLGVEDYILKPVRKQKLLTCIQSFRQKRRARDSVDRSASQEALEALFPYMEDNLISSIVMDQNLSGHGQALIRHLFPDGGAFALLLGREPTAEASPGAVHQALDGLGLRGAVSAMGGQLILLLPCPDEGFSPWRDRLLSALDGLCGGWAWAGPVREAVQLGEAFRRLAYEDHSGAGAGPAFSVGPSVEKDIAVKLATLDEAGALALFESVFAAHQWGREALDAMQRQLLSLCIVVDHYLSKMTGDASFGEIPDFRRIPERQALLQAARLYVVSRANACQARQQPRIFRLIREAVDDLEMNYQNGLYSLNAAAGNLDLSPAYLSKIFKLRMGKTFTEYLSEVRIDEAKKLLRGTQADISEIARHCGFNSANYFCKVFKKFTGVSASDYRDGREPPSGT